ncbi:unnamed protein product [Adineta steineri]|uniref:EF-hand domain-containing protein n=1 Tax=Adineta steineri TaxID=433720 RepID=A0A819VL37_9BILA|nr:unnamed protein product [Adineta steineri]CAF4110550.1 unnamed protein product [Adineta steineri]
MADNLTKQQVYSYAERDFKKVEEEKVHVTQQTAHAILKKFFPDKSHHRLLQLIQESDLDGIDQIESEQFMTIVNQLLNEDDDEKDDDFPDDESYDDRFKDFAQKMGDLANQNAPISPTTVKELLKEFKIELVKE